MRSCITHGENFSQQYFKRRCEDEFYDKCRDGRPREPALSQAEGSSREKFDKNAGDYDVTESGLIVRTHQVTVLNLTS